MRVKPNVNIPFILSESICNFEIFNSPLHRYSVLIRLGLQRDIPFLRTCQRIRRPRPALHAGHQGDLHLSSGLQTEVQRERKRIFNRMPARLRLVRELGCVPDE